MKKELQVFATAQDHVPSAACRSFKIWALSSKKAHFAEERLTRCRLAHHCATLMRYGIFSDAHGNIEALDVVLAHLKSQGCDRYAFLGDAVGYGADPNMVCDRIRDIADVAVLGNHDAAVSGRMDFEDYYEAARHALLWCQERMSSDNMAWLKSLPYQVRENDLEFCHGAPVAPEVFDYLFAPEQVAELLPAYESLAPVSFIGHSHLTISFALGRNFVRPMIQTRIECRAPDKYIITDGSVGQPRDRDPRSCCGIYDTETCVFEFHRLDYDRELTRKKILGAGLAKVFGDRLLVGM